MAEGLRLPLLAQELPDGAVTITTWRVQSAKAPRRSRIRDSGKSPA
jgi:hypothetical protein